MRRTATHILSSPNPAQLEMRILANHGGNKKFAFLLGRWGRTWQIIKGKARIERDEKVEKSRNPESGQGGAGLGILAAYGDSDGESEEGVGDDTKHAQDGTNQGKLTDAAKEARRIKAKEWVKKRRAVRDGTS